MWQYVSPLGWEPSPSAEGPMKIEQRGRVALLQMNAGKANALGPQWLAQTEALLDEILRGPARAVVITGYEGFFSAGLDLPSLVSLSRNEMTAFMDRFSATMLRVFEFQRPVVAAVNGHAIAGGCVCALQADTRIMVRGSAKIGLNEVALGVGLPAGVVETLRCQVPASSLLPVALEGKLFTSDDALKLGLVDEIVPAEDLLTRSLARAEQLAELPTLSFAHAKSQVRRPAADAVRAALAAGDSGRWVDIWLAPETQERIAAAVAKLGKKPAR